MENWVHHYDPEKKGWFVEYLHKVSPVPKKFKTQASAGEVMLTVFWSCECVLPTDFLEKGTTVILGRYIATLKIHKECIVRNGAEIDDDLLQQDNSRPHTSAATTDAIARLGFTVLPHPDYSQDLAPSDFHLFYKQKKYLRDQNFSSE